MIGVVEVIASTGAVLVAVAAAVVAIGVLAKSKLVGKPLRWLWRTNVSDPVGHWHREGVREVVDARIDHLMTHRNGGSSLKDLADAVGRNKQQGEQLDRKVSALLRHDIERDQPGLRYGSAPEEGETP